MQHPWNKRKEERRKEGVGTYSNTNAINGTFLVPPGDHLKTLPHVRKLGMFPPHIFYHFHPLNEIIWVMQVKLCVSWGINGFCASIISEIEQFNQIFTELKKIFVHRAHLS
jgi:hypothetical protein